MPYPKHHLKGRKAMLRQAREEQMTHEAVRRMEDAPPGADYDEIQIEVYNEFMSRPLESFAQGDPTFTVH